MPSGERERRRNRHLRIVPDKEDAPTNEVDFSPEQIAGLRAVGFDAIVPIRPVGAYQLREEKPQKFHIYHPSHAMSVRVPTAPKVALRTFRPDLEMEDIVTMQDGSIGLAMHAFDIEMKSKPVPEGATLDGIKFDRAGLSVMVQVDDWWKKHKGFYLLDGKFAVISDLGGVAFVGHVPASEWLRIDSWYPGKPDILPGLPVSSESIKIVAVLVAMLEETSA